MSAPEDIIQHRIGVGVVVEAGGLTAAQASDIDNRVDDLEGRAVKGILASGMYYGPLTTLSGYDEPYDRLLQANTLHGLPFIVPEDATFNQMSVWVNTAGTAGATVRLAIYTLGVDGLPSSVHTQLGTIDVTATGHRTAPVSLTLGRGLYWIGIASNQDITLRGYRGAGGQALIGHINPDGTGPAASVRRIDNLTAGFASLPTTFGALLSRIGLYVVWLRAA